MTSVGRDSRAPATTSAPGDRPRLAVLIPVFSDQEGLERSLASLALDGAEFDVFVVDDGSRRPITIPHTMPFQVRLLRQEPNQGITSALNAGLSVIAQGGYQYVARLDAGDVSLPGRFAAQMEFLDRHPDHAALGTAARYVDTQGNVLFTYHPPLDHDALRRFSRYRPGLVHPSVMMRIRALLACGFYRDEFPHGEDYDLFMRLARAYKLGNLSSTLIIKEISPGSITSRRFPVAVSRVRLLWAYFDPRSIHSYAGLAINAALILAPRGLMLRLKRLGRLRQAHRS